MTNKLTKEDLRNMFLTKRFDHPGRKTPAQVYRGEPASGIRTSNGTHEFPVQHSYGRPIRGIALSTVEED